MRFRLTTRSMNLDDTELLLARILSECREISYIWDWESPTAKRMKIIPYCQRRNCSPLALKVLAVYRLR